MGRTSRALVILAISASAAACGRGAAPAEPDAAREGAPDSGAAKRLTPEEAMKRPRPRRLRRPPPLVTETPPRWLSASHLLVSYQGAKASSSSRTKAQARRLAAELLAKAQRNEPPFSRLVREYSDAPDKRGGGYLGLFGIDGPFPEIAKAIEAVPMESIVPEVVETPYGFHVIRREKTVRVGHVLVMHRDSRFAYEGITRTREEARAEAERLRGLMTQPGADLGAIAAAHSDCRRSKAVGGILGTYGRGAVTKGGGRLLPGMIKAIMHLEPGEVSEVTETEYGFHLLWRQDDSGRAAASGRDDGEGSPDGGGPR